MALKHLSIFLVIAAVPISSIGAQSASLEISNECTVSGGLQFTSSSSIKNFAAPNSSAVYRTTKISRDFLKQYDYFLENSKKTNLEEENNQKRVKNTKNIKSKFIESPTQTHYFYETSIGLAMLTRWDFSSENKSICVPWETVNLNINENYGGLVLAIASEDETQCQWRASLFTNNRTIKYGFQLKTRCTNGEPEIDSKSVIRAFRDSIF
jgi:hypothetical protein